MSTQGFGDGTGVPGAMVREIAARHVTRPGGLLPALHAVQDELGYVPPEAVPTLAEVFNISRAEVHGVISFYHLFRTTPPGRKTLYLCRAEAPVRPWAPGRLRSTPGNASESVFTKPLPIGGLAWNRSIASAIAPVRRRS